MCILCDHGALETLTTSLDRLPPGRLAEAVRTAREAAGAGVIDRAEAILHGDESIDIDEGLYVDLVVQRAVEAGVLDRGTASDWQAHIRTRHHDPRVQAFVSSCAEIIDEYRVVATERRRTLQRFLEARDEDVRFTALGTDGEPWFEYRERAYVILTRAEALEIAQREITATLHSMPARTLLPYTGLPDTALDTLVRVQNESPEVANSILAGMVDGAALIDDRVRVDGFAPFLSEDPARPMEELRFGEWIVLRSRES